MLFHQTSGLITIPRIPDERGNISFLQNNEQAPFTIQRISWINDIPSGSKRHGQASRCATELVIALSGSFVVMVDNGMEEKRYMLNRPDVCLFVPRMHWRYFGDFATNSIILILADVASENDELILDFSTFRTEY